MDFNSDTEDIDRGVTTVVGVTILVGIVVLLAAFVGGLAFGLADTNQDTAFAGVTFSQTVDTTVEVRVDSMGEAEALLVETAGGQQVITSPGVYEYDSFGQEVRVFGSNGEATQLLQTFNPEVDQARTSDVLTVESDKTVQSTAGNQTFESLDRAKEAADAGDVIQFESGVHVKPETVNETVTESVTIVAEPNTVFSCDETTVKLQLQNATMSERSSFIQTADCGFQPVTLPSPEGSGGSVDVLAGGSDRSLSNTQTGIEIQPEGTTFGSTTESNTVTSQPSSTEDTSVTLRISSTNNYESMTVDTQAGSRTFTEPGVYDVETHGYNATITGTTESGDEVTIDKIVTEEQEPDITSNTTQQGETVNKTEIQPANTYLVKSDEEKTNETKTSDLVKRVDTLSQADEQATQGDLIKLESGVHSDPETVTASLSTNTTLAIGPNVELSCEKTKISISLGKASLSNQSPFPDVLCDNNSTVINDPPEAVATIPETAISGDSITLSAAGTSDPDSTNLTIEWDVDTDGVYEKSGEKSTHTYTTVGKQNITLKVTDGGGATDITTASTTIKNAPPSVTVQNSTFRVIRTTENTTFTAVASDRNNDVANLSLEWDVDNDGSYEQSGSQYTYSPDGDNNQTIVLKSTDPYGDTDIETVSVESVSPSSCSSILDRNPDAETGEYTLLVGNEDTPVTVTCDMETDGGGWMVIDAETAKKLYDSQSQGTLTSYGDIRDSGFEQSGDVYIQDGSGGGGIRYDIPLPSTITEIQPVDVVIQARTTATSDIRSDRYTFDNWGDTGGKNLGGGIGIGSPTESGPALTQAEHITGTVEYSSGETFRFGGNGETRTVPDTDIIRIQMIETGGQYEGWEWENGAIYVR